MPGQYRDRIAETFGPTSTVRRPDTSTRLRATLGDRQRLSARKSTGTRAKAERLQGVGVPAHPHSADASHKILLGVILAGIQKQHRGTRKNDVESMINVPYVCGKYHHYETTNTRQMCGGARWLIEASAPTEFIKKRDMTNYSVFSSPRR